MSEAKAREQFQVLYKSAEGKSLDLFIYEVLGNKYLFNFTEFLELEKITKYAESGEGGKKFFNLMQVFSTGTYKDYKKNETSLPKLKEKHILKLKKLSILSLAEKSRTIGFHEVQEACQLANDDEIEELILECCMDNILQCDISHQNRNINIRYSKARDLKAGEDKQILAMLRALIAKGRGAQQVLDKELKTIDSKVRKSNMKK